MSKLNIAVIIGSTRDARFAPTPAAWIADLAGRRDDLDVEIVDLKGFDLPFFNEVASNAWRPSQDPRAIAWQKKISEFDGYVVVTAEYNHSITAALKNAFDQAYVEWGRKPIGFVGYGGVGAARAIEHARAIAVELQMVPVRSAVHIGGGDFVKVVHQRQPMTEIETSITPAANEMLDQLAWWGRATKAAR
ncbi:NADPH-dependent FMN reductase [Caulobacter endophyticus]|uniref:FMN reductase n=1 Tax=Caulobacter endophyticus TaxID=2172652 RepID=A0A2T9K9S4_9CAUL|nr:NADPH-dependent FMN reductase [Caulobacter endophyticus]PVM92717.1 FMN reductase [Caulobacter endophyticus]